MVVEKTSRDKFGIWYLVFLPLEKTVTVTVTVAEEEEKLLLLPTTITVTVTVTVYYGGSQEEEIPNTKLETFAH